MKRILMIALALVLVANQSDAREWTDATGQERAEAAYVRSDSEYVYVRLADASGGRIKRDRLSTGDREYVAQLERGFGDTPITPLGSTPPGTPAETPPAGATPEATAPSATATPDATAPGATPPYTPPTPGATPGATAPAAAAGATTTEEADATADIPPHKIRFVYRGCGTAQHLAGERGTTVYYGKGGLTVAALKYQKQDKHFFFYTVDEPGLEKERWAFARFCSPSGFPVWRCTDANDDGNYEWVFAYCAERYRAVAPN
jgi:hypothetical protein